MHFGFCWQGLAVFLLPMLINIAYAVFPPRNPEKRTERSYPVWSAVEQISRVLYAAALCVLVSDAPAGFLSLFLWLTAVFFILYHVAWIRYFCGGRDVRMLGARLWLVPMPLAVFPVMYFFFAALWLHNIPAAVAMTVFGVAHNVISYKNLHT